jgi:Hint domain
MGGTRILTPSGEVNVEELKRGDLVLTTDGSSAPVCWIGRQAVTNTFADEEALPVRVKAGALDANVPSRDLLVSDRHALLVEGVLIQAGALINGATISRERGAPKHFVYYHVELDTHSLILAENTPAETFVDNVDRERFDNWHEYEALYPMAKALKRCLCHGQNRLGKFLLPFEQN